MALPLTLACPLAGGCTPAMISTRFGVQAAIGGGIHTGLDLRCPIGTRVLAPAAGIVKRWIENVGGGHGMEVEHNGYSTLYFHLSTRLASPGAKLVPGDTIARSGASGLVTGPHLHFEVHDGSGGLVDPEPLLFGGRKIEYPPSPGISAYPLPAGMSCPAGYTAGTVDPRIGALPFSLWWNRPTNPDGTVNACVQTGLAPGDNAALADAGEAVGAAWGAIIGVVLPVAINVGVIVLVLILAVAGVRQTLAGATA